MRFDKLIDALSRRDKIKKLLFVGWVLGWVCSVLKECISNNGRIDEKIERSGGGSGNE